MSNVSTTTLMKRDLEFVMNKNLSVLRFCWLYLQRFWFVLGDSYIFSSRAYVVRARSARMFENINHVNDTSLSELNLSLNILLIRNKTTRIRILNYRARTQVQRIMKPIRKYETSVQDVFVDHVWHCALRPLVLSDKILRWPGRKRTRSRGKSDVVSSTRRTNTQKREVQFCHPASMGVLPCLTSSDKEEN